MILLIVSFHVDNLIDQTKVAKSEAKAIELEKKVITSWFVF